MRDLRLTLSVMIIYLLMMMMKILQSLLDVMSSVNISHEMQVCYDLENGLTAHHWLNHSSLTTAKHLLVYEHLHVSVVIYVRPEMCFLGLKACVA